MKALLDKRIKHQKFPGQFLLGGFFLGIAYWFLDSAVMSFLLGEGQFLDVALHPDNDDVWMRSFTCFLFIIFGACIDNVISSRTQAVDELKKSEERFKDIAESTSDWFWEMGADLRFTYHSQKYFEITGFLPEVKIGTARSRYVEPSNLEMNTKKWAAHEECLKKHNSFKNFEYEFKGKAGQPIKVRISGAPIFDDEGNFQGYRGAGTDITELQTLKETRERLSQAVEAVPVGIALFDKDDKLLFFNQRYAEQMKSLTDILRPGVTFEEMIRTIVERQPVKDAIGREEEFIQERIKHHHNPSGPFDIRREDEWLMVTEVCLIDGSIFTIITDITERKKVEIALMESEERFRLMLENAIRGVISINERGVILSFNGAAERMFQYEADEVIGRNVSILVPATDSSRHDGYIQNYLKTGKGKIIGLGREVEGVRKDGSVFPIMLGISNLTIGDKQIFTGFIEDITERNSLQEQLIQSQKMEAVGQLTGGVAHDFNNLLAVIMGNIELAASSDEISDEIREFLESAVNAVDKGARLTDQLLSFSRQQSLSPEIVSPNNLLFDTISLLQRTIGEDLNIKTAFESHVPLIKVDPGLLGNAILNLANNARDAMPNGGTLSVKTARVEFDGETFGDDQSPATGPHVLIAVSDTGIGINQKDLAHVFEPFFTTKGVSQGTGLGLSMVHGFVKQSGGHITIDSKRGKGTTVNLYFPVAESPDEETEERLPRPEIETTGLETILVVEDNEDVRKVTVRMLNILGYEVLESEDAPSALKLLKNNANSVDLVFSDVVMPAGMSGIDLAKEVKRHYQGIKVLLTSGYPDKVLKKGGIADAGVLLIRKPYKNVQLAEAVRGALDK